MLGSQELNASLVEMEIDFRRDWNLRSMTLRGNDLCSGPATTSPILNWVPLSFHVMSIGGSSCRIKGSYEIGYPIQNLSHINL